MIFRSMKQNLIVFLADMFNVLEIHPVKCVRYPGMDKNASGKLNCTHYIHLYMYMLLLIKPNYLLFMC